MRLVHEKQTSTVRMEVMLIHKVPFKIIFILSYQIVTTLISKNEHQVHGHHLHYLGLKKVIVLLIILSHVFPQLTVVIIFYYS